MADLQFDNVRVSEKLEVLDFPADLAHHVQTAYLLPVQDFHGHLVLGQLVLAHCEKTPKMTMK